MLALPGASGGRVRRPGGGRKPGEEVDPELKQALDRILEETTAGDPMSYLCWTNKSTRVLAQELRRQGHEVSHVTVARLLHQMGYSLQGNVKTWEGNQHPDRDQQFRYLNEQVREFVGTKDPVISVDTKKKELVGRFENRGRKWKKADQAEAVWVHDFPSMAQGKAGTYDVARDEALVNVGLTHDTVEFAVESIRRCWKVLGESSYPQAQRVLICADAGGSNGNRLRSWKVYFEQFSDELQRPITVGHYPPGTSKWNQIEQRLFSFVSMNWKGRPLVSYEAVVNLIGSTPPRSGLQVKALLDEKHYATGQQIPDHEREALHLKPHAFHGEWNYTLQPRKTS